MAYSLVIVDDEQVSLDGLTSLIDWQSLGFEVAASLTDGSEAIEFLEHHEANVVLTDIKMTDVSGIDLAAWIHENRPDIKIVLISAHRRFDYAKEAIKYGVIHYLLKPFPLKEIDELFTTIREEFEAESCTDIDSTDESDPTARVQEYIRRHYAENITLNDLSDQVYLTPGYLSRLFSDRTGENISSFISRVRVEKAKELLSTTRLRVYEVCGKIGYSDLRHFYAVFKKYSGDTPTEYRKRTRNG